MRVLKISVSSKVTDSKSELWTFKNLKSAFRPFLGGPPQPSHPPENVLEISFWVWLKIEVWPYQRHWHIPRDRVSPSTRKFPGNFLLDGISLDPTSRRKFPGSFPPDVEKKNKLCFVDIKPCQPAKQPASKPASQQAGKPASNQQSWRPSGRLKGGVWAGDSPPRK